MLTFCQIQLTNQSNFVKSLTLLHARCPGEWESYHVPVLTAQPDQVKALKKIIHVVQSNLEHVDNFVPS